MRVAPNTAEVLFTCDTVGKLADTVSSVFITWKVTGDDNYFWLNVKIKNEKEEVLLENKATYIKEQKLDFELWKEEKTEHFLGVLETWQLESLKEAFWETFHRMCCVFKEMVVSDQIQEKTKPIPKAEKPEDFTMETENISETECMVSIRPKFGETPRYDVRYETTINASQSIVKFHIGINDLDNQKFYAWASEFSYKASVRVTDIEPFFVQTISLIKRKATEADLTPEVLGESFREATHLLRKGINIGVNKQHQKKSKKLDKKDDNLLFEE